MILITGSAQNLGEKLALSLNSKYPLLLHYCKSEKRAVELKEKLSGKKKIEIVQGDFSTPQGVKTFLDKIRKFPISHLIYNVGNYQTGSYLENDTETLRELMQINFFTAHALIKTLLPSIEKRRGSIVNLGMVGLRVKGDIHLPLYNITKLSLLHLTKSLAKELASRNVPVNMVSPGYLETSVDLPEMCKLPMGRTIELSEVVRVVEFLLDERSCSITGQNIEVAGGVAL